MYEGTDIELKGRIFQSSSSYVIEIRFASITNCVFLLQVLSVSCPKRMDIAIQWYLRYYPCHNEFLNIEVSARDFSRWRLCSKSDLSWLFPNAQMAIHYLQEMYERTSQSRGQSLDPNPMGQGEFIEHRHTPITCNNETRSFPMLKVGSWRWTLQHGTFFSTGVGP